MRSTKIVTADRFIVETTDGRQATLVPSDDAGAFRVEIVAADPWHAMLHIGEIDDRECAAADCHAAKWIASGWIGAGRCGFEPAVSNGLADFADRMGKPEMEAWRTFRLAQVAMPVFARAVVYNCIAFCEVPRTGEMRAFRIGLRRLATFYGL